jgi:hypothetical protein
VSAKKSKKTEGAEEQPRKRRSNWAQQAEHLVPGGRGKDMTDDELELWLAELARRRHQ